MARRHTDEEIQHFMASMDHDSTQRLLMMAQESLSRSTSNRKSEQSVHSMVHNRCTHHHRPLASHTHHGCNPARGDYAALSSHQRVAQCSPLPSTSHERVPAFDHSLSPSSNQSHPPCTATSHPSSPTLGGKTQDPCSQDLPGFDATNLHQGISTHYIGLSSSPPILDETLDRSTNCIPISPQFDQGSPDLGATPSQRQSPSMDDDPSPHSKITTPCKLNIPKTPPNMSYMIIEQTGELVMNHEGKKLIARLHELVVQVYRHSIVEKWRKQDPIYKDYIIHRLHTEFPQPSLIDQFSSAYICKRICRHLAHLRSTARDAYHNGLQRPGWLDKGQWKKIKDEIKENPDKWKQQKEAASARVAIGSSSHLGSGGWASFETDFHGFTGRSATKLEKEYARRHGIMWLIDKLFSRGGEHWADEELREDEISD